MCCFTVCEPLTVAREYPVQWARPRIDLRELAILRRDQGWALTKLAAHFGRSKGTICYWLNRPADSHRAIRLRICHAGRAQRCCDYFCVLDDSSWKPNDQHFYVPRGCSPSYFNDGVDQCSRFASPARPLVQHPKGRSGEMLWTRIWSQTHSQYRLTS